MEFMKSNLFFWWDLKCHPLLTIIWLNDFWENGSRMHYSFLDPMSVSYIISFLFVARVLKRGGRFLCIELSHVDTPIFKEL